ncbi:MAG: hypothetical protein IJZ44_04790 [Lachnospiraceae bacterium]|nr:hypothetical protein [Lachnospiraceae bacterium]
MKKRVLMIMMAIVMTASLTACGTSESGKGKGVSKVEETEAEEETEDEEEAEEAEEKEEADAKEDRKKDKDKDKSDTPVIGNDVDDYDGFEYLTAYTITGEDATTVVYAPDDEYAFGGDEETYVGTELNGVYVEYEIDAYVQYEQEDFSAEENIDYYVSDWYDYRLEDEDVLDAEMSEIKTVGDDAAYASITRYEYDDVDDRNYFVWDLYYLYQTDEKIILAEIQVDSCYDIEGAEDVVKELEQYLDADFDYDEDAMQAKADDCDVADKPDVDDDDDDDDDDDVNGGGANADGTFSTDYWTFELPEGWDEDPIMESTNQYAYAPNGDVEEAECAVMIQSEYLGEDTSVIEDMDEDTVIAFIEEIMQEELSDAECEMLGDTPVGYTVQAEFEYEGVDVVAYFVFDDYYTHIILAMQYGGGTEAFDAAECLIYSAEKN